MERMGKWIVKFRIPILILGIALLFPSALGYLKTRINYDILSYLPGEIETMQGQEILEKEFGTGAFSMIVVEGMKLKEVAQLKAELEKVDHVKKIIWYDSFADISIPPQLLPDKLREVFLKQKEGSAPDEADSTLMAVIYDTTMSADETMEAIGEMRRIADERCFISGMSAIVTDTRDLSDRETPVYVALAVALCALVLSLTMDSFLIPLFFLLSIGMAVVYNLGSNVFLGQISYITKALSAVLQLGVTLDYSIFLWHSFQEMLKDGYDEKEAMAKAIAATFTSVIGSSVTTVAGFIALCFMSFTLGRDLGIVMAKGVLIGVVCCVTNLPAMILLFHRAINKTKHRPLMPSFRLIPKFVQKCYPVILIAFVLIWIPAIKGYRGTGVYYDLAGTLPKWLPSITANEKLDQTFEMNTTHIVLVDSSLPAKDKEALTEEIKKVDGVKSVIGIDSLMGSDVPRELLPSEVTEMLVNDRYEMMMITSEYKTASDEVNAQCDRLSEIIKKYDGGGMLVGEAPCTKDLIRITDQDFKTVNFVSIGVILAIILFVFGSISLPFILVFVIEFAIFINMGIPYYTGTTIPFIASIVIGTIQLGSTVDYAILMTTRYKQERRSGKDRKEAVRIAHETSIPSILVSALSFFAATFGVGLYSEIDMISALCVMMARGALISMVVVILVLPSMLLALDWLIVHTSMGFKEKTVRKESVRS